MSYVIRKIANGILIETPTGGNNRGEEYSITDSEGDIKTKALEYIDSKKEEVTSVYVERAKERLERILSQEDSIDDE